MLRQPNVRFHYQPGTPREVVNIFRAFRRVDFNIDVGPANAHRGPARGYRNNARGNYRHHHQGPVHPAVQAPQPAFNMPHEEVMRAAPARPETPEVEFLRVVTLADHNNQIEARDGHLPQEEAYFPAQLVPYLHGNQGGQAFHPEEAHGHQAAHQQQVVNLLLEPPRDAVSASAGGGMAVGGEVPPLPTEPRRQPIDRFNDRVDRFTNPAWHQLEEERLTREQARDVQQLAPHVYNTINQMGPLNCIHQLTTFVGLVSPYRHRYVEYDLVMQPLLQTIHCTHHLQGEGHQEFRPSKTLAKMFQKARELFLHHPTGTMHRYLEAKLAYETALAADRAEESGSGKRSRAD